MNVFLRVRAGEEALGDIWSLSPAAVGLEVVDVLEEDGWATPILRSRAGA